MIPQIPDGFAAVLLSHSSKPPLSLHFRRQIGPELERIEVMKGLFPGRTTAEAAVKAPIDPKYLEEIGTGDHGSHKWRTEPDQLRHIHHLRQRLR